MLVVVQSVDRHDLGSEMSRCLGCAATLLAFHGKTILSLARNRIPHGDALRGEAHVFATGGIGEAVAQCGIDEHAVPELVTGAGALEEVRGV